jgi:prepilin-type N-terminal cleavage/methylation domain-containing protein
MREAIAKSQNGFTLQELMVSLVVASLVVSFCVSALLFSKRLVTSWQRRVQVQDVAEHTLNAITRDVSSSKRLLDLSDTSLVLLRHDGVMITYKFSRFMIQRSNVALNDPSDVQLRLVVHREQPAGQKLVTPLLKVKVSAARMSLVHTVEY